MRGDILLVSGAQVLDRFIQVYTWGKYSHVAIDLGWDQQLGAEGDGVKPRPLRELGNPKRVTVVTLLNHASATDIERGLTFIRQQINDGYSYGDIFDDIFPAWFPGQPLIRQPHAYDCSDLVARYLDVIDVIPLSAWLESDAHTVSPNDLGRAFKARGWIK